jgi:quinol monooxygenase YgiN
MVIVEYIRYVLKEHTPDTFVAAYAEAARHLAAAPECVDYELTQCVDEQTSFVLRIRWLSAEAHLKVFRMGPNFPPFLAAIRPFVSEIAEMRHYALTAVAGGGSAAS